MIAPKEWYELLDKFIAERRRLLKRAEKLDALIIAWHDLIRAWETPDDPRAPRPASPSDSRTEPEPTPETRRNPR